VLITSVLFYLKERDKVETISLTFKKRKDPLPFVAERSLLFFDRVSIHLANWQNYKHYRNRLINMHLGEDSGEDHGDG
jgi:hypothetical protein